MSKRRDKTVAKRRRQKLNLDNLAPKIAQGITEGANAKEALQELNDRMGKVENFSGDDLVQQHLGGEQEKLGRVPVPRFVASDDTHSVWKESDGRLQRNAVMKFERETFAAIEAGYICLRCLEPQEEGFPEECSLCGYPIRERQALDVKMEFRGEEHVGPGLPIAQWEAEQEQRMEEALYKQRKREGHSPQKFVSRRVLSPGAKRLRGLVGKTHADPALVKEVTRAKKD